MDLPGVSSFGSQVLGTVVRCPGEFRCTDRVHNYLSRVSDLRFRVLGFVVLGPGSFRCPKSLWHYVGSRVSDLRSRVSGSVFRGLGFGIWVKFFEVREPWLAPRVPSLPSLAKQNNAFLCSNFDTLTGYGAGVSDFGSQVSGFGFRVLFFRDSGTWARASRSFLTFSHSAPFFFRSLSSSASCISRLGLISLSISIYLYLYLPFYLSISINLYLSIYLSVYKYLFRVWG